MLAIVAAFPPNVVHLVAREGQGAFHLLVGHPPIAPVNILIGAAVLEKNANPFWLHFTNDGGIRIAAAEADVSANAAEDPAESIRPLPGSRERANGPRTCSSDGPIVAIGAEVQVLLFGN